MMSNKPLILLNVALLGLVLWLAFKPQPTQQAATNGTQVSNPSANAEIAQLRQRIAMLEQDLNEDIAARIGLEQRLKNMQTVSVTESSSWAASQLPQPIPENNEFETFEQDNTPETLEERLLAVGMPSDTIQAMKTTVDRKQWEMLQLRDRAIREGWDDSDEFREQMVDLRNPFQSLREEFGDEAYDQYLYASGTPNRVEIQEVYTGSAAADAGLQPGDIVLSYATDTIYSMSTLRQSTLEGVAGEPIMLEVERDGSVVTTSVPRGPLGITMSAIVVKPE